MSETEIEKETTNIVVANIAAVSSSIQECTVEIVGYPTDKEQEEIMEQIYDMIPDDWDDDSDFVFDGLTSELDANEYEEDRDGKPQFRATCVNGKWFVEQLEEEEVK